MNDGIATAPLAVIVATTLLLGALSPSVARAGGPGAVAAADGPGAVAGADGPGEATQRYLPVGLRTNFEDEDPARAKRIQPLLEHTALEALEHEHGVQVVGDDEAASAILIIYVRNLEEDARAKRTAAVMDYGVRVEVQVDGESAGDEVVFCTEKGEAELVECALSGLPPVLQYLPTELVPVSPSDPPDPAGPPGDRQGESDRVAPIGPLGIVGVVLGVGGIATASFGGVDLARGEVTETTLAAGRSVTDYRPRGRVLLGAGLAALVAGAVMVGVDVGLRAKKRSSDRRSTWRLDSGPGLAGLGLHGRF